MPNTCNSPGLKNASLTPYDNTSSGLVADNTQTALDEIVSVLPATPVLTLRTTSFTVYIDNIAGNDATLDPTTIGTPAKTLEGSKLWLKNNVEVSGAFTISFRFLTPYTFDPLLDTNTLDPNDFINGYTQQIIEFGVILGAETVDFTNVAYTFKNFVGTLRIRNIVFVNSNITIEDCGAIALTNTVTMQSLILQRNNTLNVLSGGTYSFTGIRIIGMSFVDFTAGASTPLTTFNGKFFAQNVEELVFGGILTDASTNKPVILSYCDKVQWEAVTIQSGVLTQPFQPIISLNYCEVDLSQSVQLYLGTAVRRPIMSFDSCYVTGRIFLSSDSATPIIHNNQAYLFYFRSCVLGFNSFNSFDIVRSFLSNATPVFSGNSVFRTFIVLEGGTNQTGGRDDAYIKSDLYGGVGIASSVDLASVRLGENYDNSTSGLTAVTNQEAIDELAASVTTPKQTDEFSVSRNANLGAAAPQDLRRAGNVATNQAPYYSFFNGTITEVLMTQNGLQDWNLDLIINGVTTTVSKNNGAALFTAPLSLTVTPTDSIRLRYAGSTATTPRPSAQIKIVES